MKWNKPTESMPDPASGRRVVAICDGRCNPHNDDVRIHIVLFEVWLKKSGDAFYDLNCNDMDPSDFEDCILWSYEDDLIKEATAS